MPGKIFISCGQHTPEERELAQKIAGWLEDRGFSAYVAIQAQSIQDVNSGIIDELKSSDYYIFIDFPRETLLEYQDKEDRMRGSLFTNQELAIAYILEFDQAIFLRHADVRLEGLASYMLSNARKFRETNEVFDIAREEVTSRGWSPDYSRHLVVAGSQWDKHGDVIYSDQTGSRPERIFHICIENRRHDKGAIQTTARLAAFTDPTGKQQESPDLSNLKWAGHVGYEQTIRPLRSEKIDAFGLDYNNPTHVYLHSASDVTPRRPIIDKRGIHVLHYEIFSQNFPLLEFSVRLDLTGSLDKTNADLVKRS